MMDRLISVLYSAAMCLILGAALCADGLAELPHGFIILFAVVGVAGAMVLAANKLEDEAARGRRGRRR